MNQLMDPLANQLEAGSEPWISGAGEATAFRESRHDFPALLLDAAHQHPHAQQNQPGNGGGASAEREERQRLCAATAAHDLRNPLSAAANAARALQKGVNSEEEHQFWTACIVRNLTSMEFLVEDFYDVVCRRRGDLELRREVFDLALLSQEVVADCRTIMLSHLLSCEGAAGWISGDRERLKRLLFNLISNAVKYSDGGTRVRVEVWPRESNVCLFVHDQGKGIPPAETERIFLPFTRLDPSGDTAGEGLGLASVKRIADAHGAAVLVQGAPGRGTTFEICFPAEPEPPLSENSGEVV